MNKGFVSLVIIAVIGAVTLVAGGGAYGVYKYSQIAEEKQVLSEELDNRKDVEIQKLQEQVDSFESDDETVIEEDEVLVTYYIEPENANVRPCTDTSNLDCSPLGQYKQNTEIKLSYTSLNDAPEWVPVDWNGNEAYVSKIVLSESKVLIIPSVSAPSFVVSESDTVPPIEKKMVPEATQDKIIFTDKTEVATMIKQLQGLISDAEAANKDSENIIDFVYEGMAKQYGNYSVQKACQNLVDGYSKHIEISEKMISNHNKLVTLFDSFVTYNVAIKDSSFTALINEGTQLTSELTQQNKQLPTLIDVCIESRGDAYDDEAAYLKEVLESLQN
jgi:cell division protein FtsB